MDPYGSVTS